MDKIKSSNDINSDIYYDSVGIRKKVFVDEQNVPTEIEIDKDEDKCTYFVLYSNQQAVATARFQVTSDNGIHIQRVAVLKSFRHQHLGSDLLKYIIDYAQKQNFDYIILGAQDHAQAFYTQLGFKVIGEQYKEAGILHHDMKLSL
ncbi:GNAT family N-acetyltransferase [Companilactobacillus paralimentarius DSM 13238 = JCM 10415]|jgi:Predicted acyltransferase|uniref:GNAT family N-acetyltransferase n=1 Tax=Companilactobacillus paralimentarius DSM 13238 = JCM 10415 TaxID=1122151 RepID=A0A0R1PI25_9LACO|nr:GNAT family N-acetyltransferase [Companilactobacillus paralimentarius]KAE9562419.1 GNAT family acetyltransferase [Companilactobacillus paralimentarius]KRL31820.1 GNAT family N-acetyltransferase [Companilactobacillus paralimentarius DSM 13238 = JCM 10415]MDR4934724.1 GNAT family N-acetyltransferase [Companilactobacillus paralimentarius]QFR68857.1 GNAT family N-acetyltransferase [Companilactobacillus paralimentarius]